MHILVTGATGFLGRHLVRALLGGGHRVRALGRQASAFIDGAQPVRADLRDTVAVIEACDGVDAVFHVGALSSPWGPAAEFHAVNVAGTENVLAGCRSHGVRRLIHVSSPSVTFRDRDVRGETEAAPCPARYLCEYSLTKRIAEERVRASGVPAVILRPKAIFGPGDTSLLPRLLTAARRGRLPQIGPGDNRVDLTYVGNVVQSLILALDAPAALGRTYNITNGEHVPLWPLIKAVLRRRGIPDMLRRLPYRVVYLLAAGLELKAMLFGGEPLLTRYTAAILARTQTYDLTAARRDLGYTPAVSVAEGVERTLAEMPHE